MSTLDYSNIRNITSSLKKNLSAKYKDLGKIKEEAGTAIVSSSGSGAGAAAADIPHVDELDQLFNQGTYNGNLVVNGGITVDYIESLSEIQQRRSNINITDQIDEVLRRRGIGAVVQTAGATQVSTGIATRLAKNSIINSPVIIDARLENPQLSGTISGISELFNDDYIDLYSIQTSRDVFDFHTKESNSGVIFSYKRRILHIDISFGKSTDAFGVLFPYSYTNSYFKSEVTDVLFRPKVGEDTNSRYKIENMKLEINNVGTNKEVLIAGDMKIEGLLTVREQRTEGISSSILTTVQNSSALQLEDTGNILFPGEENRSQRELKFSSLNITRSYLV